MKMWIVILVAAWVMVLSSVGYWLSQDNNWEEALEWGGVVARVILKIPQEPQPETRWPKPEPRRPDPVPLPSREEILTDKQRRADKLKKEGDKQFQAKRYDDAIREYTLALIFNPDHVTATCGRANARAMKKDYDAAIKDYTACIIRNPNNYNAYLNRGVAHTRKKMWASALTDFEKAQRIKPNKKKPYMYAGMICVEMKMYAWAISDFKEAIKRFPDDPDPYNSLAWLLATCPENKYRDGKLAVKMAQKALSLESDPEIMDTLACAYAEMGNFEKAVEIQREALDKAVLQNLENIDEFRAHLKAFKAGKAWREK